METPTRMQQWTLALLTFVLAVGISALYANGAGLTPEKPPVAVVAAIILTIGLGFSSLALVRWGNRWGYAGAMVTGLIPAVGQVGNLAGMAAGAFPAELLIVVIPLLIVSVALIYVAYLGWRGGGG